MWRLVCRIIAFFHCTCCNKNTHVFDPVDQKISDFDKSDQKPEKFSDPEPEN